jgi:hypothetical protein
MLLVLLHVPNWCRTRQGDGLLLYMDDGGYYDFLEMKLVKGELFVRYKQVAKGGLHIRYKQLVNGELFFRYTSNSLSENFTSSTSRSPRVSSLR